MALEVSPFLNEEKLILVALAFFCKSPAMCSKGTENRTLKRLRDTFGPNQGKLILLEGTLSFNQNHKNMAGESNPEYTGLFVNSCAMDSKIPNKGRRPKHAHPIRSPLMP
jgi:hypothetical protein